ncbi:hypothetical protein WM26_06065 [Burkholderia cepacia]|nr:hypothetical protein WK03_30035 [Burkholderia cepacia]KWO03867.1 hypothetical protein WM26_06065 [Burkholderia cepacia]
MIYGAFSVMHGKSLLISMARKTLTNAIFSMLAHIRLKKYPTHIYSSDTSVKLKEIIGWLSIFTSKPLNI